MEFLNRIRFYRHRRKNLTKTELSRDAHCAMRIAPGKRSPRTSPSRPVPLAGPPQPLLEPHPRLVPQLLPGLLAGDGVAPVVAGPVGHEADELPGLAEDVEDAAD